MFDIVFWILCHYVRAGLTVRGGPMPTWIKVRTLHSLVIRSLWGHYNVASHLVLALCTDCTETVMKQSNKHCPALLYNVTNQFCYSFDNESVLKTATCRGVRNLSSLIYRLLFGHIHFYSVSKQIESHRLFLVSSSSNGHALVRASKSVRWFT
jgi:ferredoxin-like protein FixX